MKINILHLNFFYLTSIQLFLSFEYPQFACRSAWDYPISIIEPGWISYSTAYGRGKRYMPKLGLLASGQYAAT